MCPVNSNLVFKFKDVLEGLVLRFRSDQSIYLKIHLAKLERVQYGVDSQVNTAESLILRKFN